MLMNPIELDENSDDEADKEAKTPSKHKRQPRATMYVTPNDARYILIKFISYMLTMLTLKSIFTETCCELFGRKKGNCSDNCTLYC